MFGLNVRFLETAFNAPLPIVLTATDADNHTLSFGVLTSPDNGTLSGDVPNRVYTPRAGFSGTDSFTFRASDASSASNVATVTIRVGADNRPPVANDQTAQSVQNTPISIRLSASGASESALTFTVANQPQNGTLTGTAPNLTYTPRSRFIGKFHAHRKRTAQLRQSRIDNKRHICKYLQMTGDS